MSEKPSGAEEEWVNSLIEEFGDGEDEKEKAEEEPMDKLDYYDEIQDELENVTPGKGGGGGSKKPTKSQLKQSKADRSEIVESRQEKIAPIIEKQLQHSPILNEKESDKSELITNAYVDWVIKSLNNGPELDLTHDIIKETVKKSSGAGGQNVNKLTNASKQTHILTGIFALSNESRHLGENEKKAFSTLYSKLEDHISNWRRYLSEVDKKGHKETIKRFLKKITSEE